MSQAAKQLYLSQPTISQAIRELEEHYEVLLFERLNKRLYITEAGKKLYKKAILIVQQFEQLESSMMESAHDTSIRIGASLSIGDCIFNDLLGRFIASNEEVKPYSVISNTDEVVKRILNNDLDVGIVEGKVDDPNLIVIPSLNDYLVLICNPDHPFAKKEYIHLDELQGEKFIMREEGSGTREMFEDYLDANNIQVDVVMESPSPDAIKKNVCQTPYLSVISICLIEEEVRDKKLHIIESNDHNWDRSYKIVYHKDKELTKVINEFIRITGEYQFIPETIPGKRTQLIP